MGALRLAAAVSTLCIPAVTRPPSLWPRLSRLALTVSTLSSVSLGCAVAYSQSSAADSGDKREEEDESPLFRLPAPLQATRDALAVLRYQPTSPPPVLHIPHCPAGPLPRLRYPVVLVHGFLGYSSLLTSPVSHQPLFEYFGELRSMYENAGITVIVPVLPRSYKVEKRAKALQVALGLIATSSEMTGETGDGRQTQRQTPVHESEKEDMQEVQRDAKTVSTGESVDEDDSVTVLTNNRIDLAAYNGPFHLIAHSMGGLDSRFLITHLQQGDNRILSLTTIGSPHHGSPLADIVVEQIQKDRIIPLPTPTISSNHQVTQQSSTSPSSPALPSFKLEQVVRLISDTFHLDFRGMLDLTTTAGTDFNRDTINRSDTIYASYSGYRPFDVWSVWYIPSKLIESREGWNDGLVSVESAKWGQWKGCVALDHLQQVGLGVMHRHLDLYREIAWHLKDVEDARWEEEERKRRERRQGKRRYAGDGRRGHGELQRNEEEAVQRKDESRDRAKQKGTQDAETQD